MFPEDVLVVHVGEGEAGHVKDEAGGLDGGLNHQTTSLHDVDGELFKGLGVLL